MRIITVSQYTMHGSTLMIIKVFMFVAFQMRHLFVVVDMSRAMEEADLKPSRLACSVKVQYPSLLYR